MSKIDYNIFLIGFMGAGKSTIARSLVQKLMQARVLLTKAVRAEIPYLQSQPSQLARSVLRSLSRVMAVLILPMLRGVLLWAMK